MPRMNAKMSKLALCALLSAGVVSAVNGDPTVKELLKMNRAELFNALPSGEKCQEAFELTREKLRGKEGTDEGDSLLALAERLNFLCGVWKWFKDTDLKSLDVKGIFSESASGDDEKVARKLIFLQDVGWGRDIVNEAGNEGLEDRFKTLKTKCEGTI